MDHMRQAKIHLIRTLILQNRRNLIENFAFVNSEYKFQILTLAITVTMSYEFLSAENVL